jgi:hypothetical protein
MRELKKLWLKKILSGILILVSGSLSAEVDFLFSESLTGELSEVEYSKKFGYFSPDSLPWLESLVLTGAYVDEVSTVDATYIWLPDLGWIFTSEALFPRVYRYSTTNWYVLDISSFREAKALSLSSGEWLVHLNHFEIGEVPEDLVGVSVRRKIGLDDHTTDIGRFMMIKRYPSYLHGEIIEIFYYNEDDGTFYPDSSKGHGGRVPLWPGRYKYSWKISEMGYEETEIDIFTGSIFTYTYPKN